MIWIILIAGVLLTLGLFVSIVAHVVAGLGLAVYRATAYVARGMRRRMDRRHRRKSGIPEDPKERQRWANREGPYDDD